MIFIGWCHFVLLWSFKGGSEFVEVQIVEARLSDSDISAGNKNSGNNKSA
jgi:hypothetical protein